jgi:hypothetical protein
VRGAAQRRKHEYVAEQIGIGPGRRVLVFARRVKSVSAAPYAAKAAAGRPAFELPAAGDGYWSA